MRHRIRVAFLLSVAFVLLAGLRMTAYPQVSRLPGLLPLNSTHNNDLNENFKMLNVCMAQVATTTNCIPVGGSGSIQPCQVDANGQITCPPGLDGQRGTTIAQNTGINHPPAPLSGSCITYEMDDCNVYLKCPGDGIAGVPGRIISVVPPVACGTNKGAPACQMLYGRTADAPTVLNSQTPVTIDQGPLSIPLANRVYRIHAAGRLNGNNAGANMSWQLLLANSPVCVFDRIIPVNKHTNGFASAWVLDAMVTIRSEMPADTICAGGWRVTQAPDNLSPNVDTLNLSAASVVSQENIFQFSQGSFTVVAQWIGDNGPNTNGNPSFVETSMTLEQCDPLFNIPLVPVTTTTSTSNTSSTSSSSSTSTSTTTSTSSTTNSTAATTSSSTTSTSTSTSTSSSTSSTSSSSTSVTTSTSTSTTILNAAATDLTTSTKIIAAWSCKPADHPGGCINDLSPAASCGGTNTDCDLQDGTNTGGNVPTSDTTSGEFVPADGQTDGSMKLLPWLCTANTAPYACCTGSHTSDGTCHNRAERTATATNVSSSFLLTSFGFLGADPANQAADFVLHSQDGVITGYRMGLNIFNANNRLGCGVGDNGAEAVPPGSASTASNYHESVNFAFPVGVRTAGACKFDAVAKTIQAYVNGSAEPSPTTMPSAMTAGSSSFRLGSNPGNWNGSLDETTLWNISGVEGTFSSAFIARLQACGIKGIRCRCVNASASYLGCTTNSDCRVGGNTTAICTSSTCRGLDMGICAGGTNANRACTVATQASDCPSSTCTLPTLAACNVAVP